MSRDPLYKQILKGLGERLDGDLFEECIIDLLRKDWPTIVPVPGGTDAGVDGVVGGEDGPFLISTTAKDPIPNLTRSLKSYLASGQPRRRVIFATSQELTARRRQSIEAGAVKHGFRVVQIYTQQAIANLLYHSPRWCRDLLGLAGDPPPLSAIPTSSAPLVEIPIVGRTEDLAWLRGTSDDRVLIGQPGSGKTFLLLTYARTSDALFLVDQDLTRVANGLREQCPKVIIVDDAHVNPDFLARLRHLRQELGAVFAIIASSWPSQADSVTEALDVQRSQADKLDLLTRDEIVEIVKSAGIAGPTPLIREIVDQAEGRPGLAVTLTCLCLQGDVRDLVLGKALARSVRRWFEKRLGAQAINYLAGFAVGGQQGMSMEEVARGFDKAAVDIRPVVTELSSSGIMRQVGDEYLSVRPAALRHALVRDVFFSGPASLDISRFLQVAPSPAEVARTLVGARALGAPISDDHILAFLETASSHEAWLDFVAIGKRESEAVLRKHPEMVIRVARPALDHAPETAVPILMQQAVGDDRALHSHTEHPLRLIEDWGKNALPGTGVAVDRRRILLEAVQRWMSSGEDHRVGLRALTFVCSPAFFLNDLDPGSGNTTTLTWGILTTDELEQIRTLWPSALQVMRIVMPIPWELVFEIIGWWAYPSEHTLGSTPKDSYSKMVRLAKQMLTDVVPLATGHQGALYRARQLAHHLSLTVDVSLEPELESIFVGNADDDNVRFSKQRVVQAQALAQCWSARRACNIVPKFVRYVREMSVSASHLWPDPLVLLSDAIAKLVSSPADWAAELVGHKCPVHHVFPFLLRAITEKDGGCDRVLADCMESEEYRLAAVTCVLRNEDLAIELLNSVLETIKEDVRLIRNECMRGFIPERNLTQILRHEDSRIGGAAALGEWEADPHRSIRDRVRHAWEDAVVRYAEENHTLAEILASDSTLAERWLEARIGERSDGIYMHHRVVEAAVGALGLNARRHLIQLLPDEYRMRNLLRSLVGDDVGLYQALLDRPELKNYYLVPLGGLGGSNWTKKARLALDRGNSPGDIAAAMLDEGSGVRWGKLSGHWRGWIKRFEVLCANGDEGIRQVGRAGVEITRSSYDRWTQQERNEEIFGD